MPPTGFEPAIPASEWLQIYALDRAATGIGLSIMYVNVLCIKHVKYSHEQNLLSELPNTVWMTERRQLRQKGDRTCLRNAQL